MAKKIQSIDISNFMKIKRVTATLNGKSVKISGNNGSGKTTILQSIWTAALGRAGVIPEPVRSGARKGTIQIILGDGDDTMTVTKTFEGGKTKLDIRDKDGHTVRKPQEVLDGLVGKIPIDPHAFLRMDDKQQYKALLEIVELKIDLESYDKGRAAIFEKRALVNREIKRIQGKRDSLPEPDDNLPDEETRPTEILHELRAAQDEATAQEQKKKHLETLRQEAATISADIKELQFRIQELEEKKVHTVAKGKALAAEVETFVAPDIAEIERRIEGIEEENAAIRKAKEWREADDEIAKLTKEADDLTAEMVKMDKEKAEALEGATMPVEGLGFEEGHITMDGVPFRQASHAEQMRVAFALLMAQNPELHVATLVDASLMDDQTWATVMEMADQHDWQILAEMVGSAKLDPEGIHMIDGEAK